MTKDQALRKALEALEEPKEHIAKHRRLEAITAIKEVLAQPEQEPVAVVNGVYANRIEWKCTPKFFPADGTNLYTTPPQRTWVGLTDEEVYPLANKHLHYQIEGYEVSGIYDLAQAIEAKLKEKNSIKGEA